MTVLTLSSAVLMIGTGVTHSLVGERRVIAPILRLGQGVVAVPLARAVIRFAWHMTTVLMCLTAATVAWHGTPPGLILLVGAGWLVAGVVDMVWSRGRHIGWPPITLAGLLALATAL